MSQEFSPQGTPATATSDATTSGAWQTSSLTSASTTPCTELRAVAWIGGAMDAYTQLLRRHVPAGQQYFQWYQYRAIKRWIQQHQQHQTLIIAHSYGASTAAAIVAEGYRVSELVTIDPVGWRKPNVMQLRRFCQHWRNYCAADPRLNFANIVARCGGHWHDWPANSAHQHQRLDVDHAMIVSKVLTLWRQPVAKLQTKPQSPTQPLMPTSTAAQSESTLTSTGVAPTLHLSTTPITRDKTAHLQLVIDNTKPSEDHDSR